MKKDLGRKRDPEKAELLARLRESLDLDILKGDGSKCRVSKSDLEKLAELCDAFDEEIDGRFEEQMQAHKLRTETYEMWCAVDGEDGSLKHVYPHETAVIVCYGARSAMQRRGDKLARLEVRVAEVKEP